MEDQEFFGASAEELEAEFDAEAPVDSPEPAADASAEPVTVDDETPDPESQSEVFELAGAQYTRDQLENVAKFHQWAASNPEEWERLQAWAAGQAQITPLTDDPVPPGPAAEGPDTEDFYDDEDEDDPRVLQAQADAQAARQAAEGTALAVASRAAADGKAKIGQRYGLDEGAVEELMQHSIDNNYVWLERQKSSDPYEIVEKALETSYRQLYFDRIAEQARAKGAEQARKRGNWRGVGQATTVRASGKEEAPLSEFEALDAMVEEIAANGNFT